MDNISKLAQKAGETALKKFKEHRADPAKCKKMVLAYDKAYKLWEAGGRKRSGVSFCVVTHPTVVIHMIKRTELITIRHTVIYSTASSVQKF